VRVPIPVFSGLVAQVDEKQVAEKGRRRKRR
jgi:hypothetical protein